VTDDGGLDPEGLAAYLLWGSIAPPRTLYRRIRALPAGSWLRVREGGPTPPRAWFSLASCFGRSRPMSPAEAGEALREALVDSARCHRVADVPVGAFLSGGVDSSALVGLLSEVGGRVRTVTLSFDRPELDEGPLARQAAELYGADHREIPIRIEEIRERLPDAIRALDQPSVDGVNTFFVSEAAVKAGLKVAVSGVGGDELFGGYPSFGRVPRIRETHRVLAGLPLGTTLLPLAARLLGSLPATRARGKLALALEFGAEHAGAYFAERGILTPREVRRLLAPELAEAVEAVDPVLELTRRLRADELPEEERVCALELAQYLQCQLLRDTDAVGMRHSLEVRTPLVDRTLLEAVARVPAALRRSGPAKRWLREAPRPPVPAALWDRPKQGFTLPFDHWLRSGGIPLALPDHPWLRPGEVRRIADGFRRGRLHFSRPWLLLVLAHFLGDVA
jgi:asparagine synthase (glutamine-hydrolysing)